MSEVRRSVASARRIVLKVGTNLLMKGDRLDVAAVHRVAQEVCSLREAGKEVLLVTSGAIGMGRVELGLKSAPEDIRLRQACAAVGQPLLMREYYEGFRAAGVICAQVLVTRDVFDDRRSYLNLRNAVEHLVQLGVVPVFNENDSVSTEEIGSAFGDNDTLSALVASKIDAELLIMLTDIDAFYTAPPGTPGARAISVVERITDEHRASAGESTSGLGRGGMRTKLAAVSIAADAGCSVIIASGRLDGAVGRLTAGEEIGTLFLPREKLGARSRWIRNSRPQGTIRVDEGALAALRAHKSLLPTGIQAVEGTFAAGAVVWINGVAKAVSSFSADELRSIVGRHSSDIARVLGAGRRDVVARPEDIVFPAEPG